MVNDVYVVNGVAELNSNISDSGDYLVTANAGCGKKVNLSVEVINDGSSVDDGYVLGSAINTLVNNERWLRNVIFFADWGDNGNLVFGANDGNERTDDFIVCEYKGVTYRSTSIISGGSFNGVPKISIPNELFDSDNPTLINFTITGRDNNSVSFSLYDVDIYNNHIELSPGSYDAEDTPVDPDPVDPTPVEPEWTKIADVSTTSSEWTTSPESDGVHGLNDGYNIWNVTIPDKSTIKITGTKTTEGSNINFRNAVSGNSIAVSINDTNIETWSQFTLDRRTMGIESWGGNFVITVHKDGADFIVNINGSEYTYTAVSSFSDWYLDLYGANITITDVRYVTDSS